MSDDNASPPPPTRDQFESRKDFVRAYDRWRDKHDPKRKARTRPEGYQAAQYAKHREKRLSEKKAYYTEKRDEIRAKQNAYAFETKDKKHAYYEANAARESFRARRSVGVPNEASPPWLTHEQWMEMNAFYEKARQLTEETGVPHEVDHIHPLQAEMACGLHVPWNLQVVTATVNRRKGRKVVDG